MPRSGDGVYSLPANTAAVTGQTIASAKYNTVNNDIANDLNAARPITAGGTGATNAADALANLGGVGQSNFLGAFPIGDFYETIRDISSTDGVWLRRNGALHDSADYPELAALLPTLPDGVNWTSLSTSIAGDVRGLNARTNNFVLGAINGSNTGIYKSTNGTDWGLVATINSFAVRAIIYGNGIYLAVDGSGFTSTSNDAVTWSSPFNLGGGSVGLTGAAFGSGLFVVCGTGGSIYSSPDGSSWTPRTSGVAGSLNDVYFGNSNFVATGASGALTTSANGTSWTSRTTGVSDALNMSTFGDGVYVAVGANGRIITSSNLTTWTPRTSGTTSGLESVLYSSSGFLATGQNGVARISGDGLTWTSSSTGVSSILYVSAFDPSTPNRYLVGGTSGTLLQGIRTLPTQFQVPNDDPTYGWIKAENAT